MIEKNNLFNNDSLFQRSIREKVICGKFFHYFFFYDKSIISSVPSFSETVDFCQTSPLNVLWCPWFIVWIGAMVSVMTRSIFRLFNPPIDIDMYISSRFSPHELPVLTTFIVIRWSFKQSIRWLNNSFWLKPNPERHYSKSVPFYKYLNYLWSFRKHINSCFG